MYTFRLGLCKFERTYYPKWCKNSSVSRIALSLNHLKAFSGKIKNEDEELNRSRKSITINPCGIQMLPRSIHHQIFGKSVAKPLAKDTLAKVQEHLTVHHLWGNGTPNLADIDFELPVLQGQNIAEHFEKIALKQCGNYCEKLLELTSHSIPDIPKIWNFAPGWTRYCETGDTNQVDFPDEDAYVFDVEVCVKEGHFPTLATAVSNKYWYSWCSNQLFEKKVSFCVALTSPSKTNFFYQVTGFYFKEYGLFI